MKKVLLFCGLILSASQAVAAFSDWHVNGFISQSALSTSDNAFLGHTDDTAAFDYREVALIARGPIFPTLEFSTQLLSRNAGVADNGSPQLDYCFLTWRWWDSEQFTHSFVIGKIKAPLGFYNEARESPFTRPSIFLP